MIYNEQPVPFYQFNHLSGDPGILHGITTRQGGVSKNEMDSMNLGYGVNDDPEAVRQNRHLLAKLMDVPDERLIFQKQTHSANHKIITEENFSETHDNNDALITATRNLALTSLGADCVPILLYDKKERVIASIHAGWKGTVNGITTKVVDAMKKHFNSKPQHILAGIGPSICAENYEVGPEVIEAFKKVFSKSGAFISGYHDNKAQADLWAANVHWLTEQGIPESNIEVSGLCTYANSLQFYSARYFKNKTGRFGSCIVLK